MDLIEKKGETVSFSCIKYYAQNMPECRILHLNFKKNYGGGLFKFKSDLFNKNEVKTLLLTKLFFTFVSANCLFLDRSGF